jgi:hypothetical protein
MKCDNCGRQFPAHEAVHDTVSEQVGPPSPAGAKTTPVMVTLCSRCGSRRHGTLWFIVCTFAVGFLVLLLLQRLFG